MVNSSGYWRTRDAAVAEEGKIASETRTNRPYAEHIKPVLDRAGGLALFILSLPLIAVSALVVRITLGSPVVLRQTRVGKDGEEFTLFKLRTMIPDRRRESRHYDGPERRQVHKSPNDPRVPAICRMLRAWRLDELPQFWNVVRGEMSLVGPRPELPEIVAHYEDWQHRRLCVMPGITGPWQISDRNGHLMHECTEMDLEYVDQITFLNDMTLLLHTPFAMIGGRRGY